jgi:hypothetical protein
VGDGERGTDWRGRGRTQHAAAAVCIGGLWRHRFWGARSACECPCGWHGKPAQAVRLSPACGGLGQGHHCRPWSFCYRRGSSSTCCDHHLHLSKRAPSHRRLLSGPLHLSQCGGATQQLEASPPWLRSWKRKAPSPAACRPLWGRCGVGGGARGRSGYGYPSPLWIVCAHLGCGDGDGSAIQRRQWRSHLHLHCRRRCRCVCWHHARRSSGKRYSLLECRGGQGCCCWEAYGGDTSHQRLPAGNTLHCVCDPLFSVPCGVALHGHKCSSVCEGWEQPQPQHSWGGEG